MGVARVYVGMHWPLDIVLGALLGMVVGSAVYYYFSQYERVITRFVATFGR
jgi:membrane-associated phospholipid phosphatase